MKTLKIDFDNDKALDHFATWLCEQGEQQYWNWMEIREDEEDGPITAIRFNYHADGEFLGDGIIRTECGRLDR